MHTTASRLALGAVAGLTALTLTFGTVAFAAANDNSNTNGNSNTNTSLRRDGTCMQAAVEKRDTAIIAAVNTFSASWVNSLTTRMAALKDAWAKTAVTERRDGVKAAWKSFRASHKAEIKTFHASRKAAWKTFVDDQKACKVTGAKDKTTSKVDLLEPGF